MRKYGMDYGKLCIYIYAVLCRSRLDKSIPALSHTGLSRHRLAETRVWKLVNLFFVGVIVLELCDVPDLTHVNPPGQVWATCKGFGVGFFV